MSDDTPTDSTLLVETPQNAEVKPFWNGVQVPHNPNDPEMQFVNPVLVAEWFAKKSADIAELAGQAEVIEEQVANLKIHLRRAEYELKLYVRALLAKHLKRVTKSTTAMQEAYVVEFASEEPDAGAEFARLEAKVQDIRRHIEVREPRRDQLYSRIKAIKDSQESAKQFLDFAKLEKKLQAALDGIRI